MIYWDPNPDCVIIPFLNWPIKWYGVLFALGFAIGFALFEGIIYRYFLQKSKVHRQADSALKQNAVKITDRVTVYMVIATAVGARLGHFLFYERPSEYLNNPLEILRTWEGGLASHGAAIAIIFALWLVSKWAKKMDSGLNLIRLLDLVCVPTALAGAFIRFGNFINQEILGTPTDLPWAVVFGHPADGSIPIPRHPVQLYEAFFYLAVFFLLWRLSFHRKFLYIQGGLIGLFLVLVFGFRTLIEFLKLEQSWILPENALTMGQWLSIPLVILGLLLLLRWLQRS